MMPAMEIENLADGVGSPRLDTCDSMEWIIQSRGGAQAPPDARFAASVYLVIALLDCVNISNASIEDMAADLHPYEGSGHNVALLVCPIIPYSWDESVHFRPIIRAILMKEEDGWEAHGGLASKFLFVTAWTFSLRSEASW